MLSFFFQLLLAALALSMFFVKQETKYHIFLFSIICLTAITVSFVPFGNCKYILSYCFLLSEGKNISSYIKRFKELNLWKLVIAMMIATIIWSITSPHCNNVIEFLRLLIMELIGKYFAIFYAFMCIKDRNTLKKSYKIAYYGILLLTFFGIINLLTGYSVFIKDVLGEAVDFTHSERFRVQSMFDNWFDYGYINAILLLYFIWGYSNRMISKRVFYITACCCVFGVFASGCRTNYLVLFVAIISYVLLAFKQRRSLKYLFLVSMIGIVAYVSVPSINEKINQTVNMFSVGDTSTSGSSIEMRTLQYATMWSYVRNDYLFGRGWQFFEIDMGWGKKDEGGLVDHDLWGIEGVFMSLLLERGIVGVLFYLFFYISLSIVLWSYRKYDKKTTALCFSMLLAYACFANISGELDTVFPTLFFIGAFLKYLDNIKRNANSIRNEVVQINA